MKRLSTSTKYFVYDLLVVLVSIAALFGAGFATCYWADTIIHTSPLAMIMMIFGDCAICYWNFIVINAFTSSGSQKDEDR